MKNSVTLLLVIVLVACHKKKLIEVVEVPLPSKNEKIEIGSPDEVTANEGAFELKKLPFKYTSLEPAIDAVSLENQYSKIYLNYTNNLNQLIKENKLENLSLTEIFKKTDANSADLKNNAGGYYNHGLYFDNLGTQTTEPKDTLSGSIKANFQNFENFKTQFTNAAVKVVGSGWAFLVVNKKGALQISTCANNDNPLMSNQLVSGTPIFTIDLWEHAYYIQNLNQRKKYIDAVFKVVDWKKVGTKFEEAIQPQ